MAPFIDDENTAKELNQECPRERNISFISDRTFFHDSNEGGAIFDDEEPRSVSFLNDKKIIIAGATASVLLVSSILVYVFTKDNSVDIEELPVIHATHTAIKESVDTNEATPTKDKKIYTYITTDEQSAEPSKVEKTDSVISIKELETSKLTEEDKRTIIKAFEDLAPNARRRKAYKPPEQPKLNLRPAKVIQPAISKPVIKKPIIAQNTVVPAVKTQRPQVKQRPALKLQDILKTPISKKRRSDELNRLIHLHNKPVSGQKTVKNYPIASNGIFVQLASLPTRAAAQNEYKRLKRYHRVLDTIGYKINEVKVGREKRYRVMAGPFRNRDAARIAVQRMRNSGLNPLW